MFSPGGVPQHGGRPVVRLPHAMAPFPQHVSPGGSHIVSYPLPQTPAIEHYRETTTMHQPRPQKTISVSGIESPATMALHAPQQQQNQQPFENQLPHHIAEGSQSAPSVDGAGPPSFYPYQGQFPTGTPLSNIPERAIHAQPFEPPGQPYGHAFYGQQYAQPNYYYPPAMPVYAAPQTSYAVPSANPIPAVSPAAQGQAPAGTVAHESNGMVFYLDASQVSQPQYAGQEQYQPQESYLQAQSYAVPGMGGMMTPSPEGGYYYPPVAPGGGMYYHQQ